MPYDLHIDPAAGLTLVRFSGKLTGPEVMEAMEAVFTHPDWQPAFDVIWDGSRNRQLVLVPGELERFVALLDRHRSPPGAGRDVVVVVREVDYVVARLYEHLSRKYSQRLVLCHSLEQAVEKLGLTSLPPALEAAAGGAEE